MDTVTVSSKYQVVIPQAVRQTLNVKPGDKFVVMPWGDDIEMVRVPTLKELRGILRGMDTTIETEPDRF